MKMIRIVLSAIMILSSALPASAEFFKYRDKNGALRFTDNILDIPEDQRPSAQRYIEADDLLTSEQKAEKARREATEKEPSKKAEEESAASAEKTKEPDDRVVFERLSQAKTALDREYEKLQKESDALARERETAKNKADAEGYVDKVEQLNKRIEDYEKRREAFKVEADAFNTRNRQ